MEAVDQRVLLWNESNTEPNAFEDLNELLGDGNPEEKRGGNPTRQIRTKGIGSNLHGRRLSEEFRRAVTSR